MQSPSYTDSSKPDHKEVVERVNSLAKAIYGDGTEKEAPPPYSTVPRPSLPPEIAERWPEDAEAFFRQEGLAAGLSNKQIEHLLGALAKETIADHEEEKSSMNAGLHALRQRWGEAFDRKLGQAWEALRQFDPSLAELLNDTGLGNEPALIEVFAVLGESMKERGLMMSNVDEIKTDEDAKKEWQRLTRSEPYLDGNHRNHKAVVENANKLAMRIFGDTPAGRD